MKIKYVFIIEVMSCDIWKTRNYTPNLLYELKNKQATNTPPPHNITFLHGATSVAFITNEYHAVGDTWWQALLSYEI